MGKERFGLLTAISLLLVKEDKILLIRRYNTGWEDGKYSLVGGHLEKNETVAQTTIREVKEEIGITIAPKDLKVVHTMHTSTNDNYLDFFLLATQWEGEPVIKEKNKIDDLRWFPLNNLPKNMPRQIMHGINGYLRKETFSEFKH